MKYIYLIETLTICVVLSEISNCDLRWLDWRVPEGGDWSSVGLMTPGGVVTGWPGVQSLYGVRYVRYRYQSTWSTSTYFCVTIPAISSYSSDPTAAIQAMLHRRSKRFFNSDRVRIIILHHSRRQLNNTTSLRNYNIVMQLHLPVHDIA